MKKQNLTFKLSLLFFLLLGVQIFAQTKLYVSPDGSGDMFTKSHPGSLYEVQKKVRSINGQMNEDIIISLLKGAYSLASPLEFDSSDSGNNGYRVIYRANKQGTVFITGGKQISGWHATDNGMYKAKWDGNGFRNLYVNGKRMTRARIPNMTEEDSYGPYYRNINVSLKDHYIRLHSEHIEEWSGFNDVEMVMKKHWGQSRMRPSYFEREEEGTRVYFCEPETSIDAWSMGCCPGFDYGQTFYFENSIDFLDVAGEWFLDRTSSEVYYKPSEEEDITTAEVVAPVQEVLVMIDGAAYISFEDLVFEYTNFDLPNDARIGIQAGWRRAYNRTFIPGGIQVVRANNLHFKRNIIRHFGGSGIEYLHTTHDNIIEGNLITDISANGIQINITIDSAQSIYNETCSREVIRDNYVIKAACEYTGNVAIMATYADNLLITHNEISEMPYTGISVGWGWADTVMSQYDNTISFNKIHHTGRLHDDGSGIYTLSKMDRSVIHDNYLYEIRLSKWASNYTFGGIYLDNGSSEILIEDNVIKNVDVYPMVAWNEPNHSNIFQNNFYTDIGKLHIRETNTVVDNYAIKDDNWPKKALEIMKKSGPRLPMPKVRN